MFTKITLLSEMLFNLLKIRWLCHCNVDVLVLDGLFSNEM